MKTILCLLLLSFSAIAEDNIPPLPQGMQAGRFQIVAGTAPGLRINEGLATMFRVDTATGKVWQLQAVPMQTANQLMVVPVWVECNEVGGTLYKAAMDAMTKR